MPSYLAQATGDIAILNGAIELEQQAQWTYAAASKSGLLKPEVVAVATKIAGQHGAHESALADAVKKLGGTAPKAKDSYPLPELKSQEDVLKYALKLETQATNAYFEAFTKLSDKALKLAGISIMNDEAQHVAVLRGALGLDPVESATLPLKAI